MLRCVFRLTRRKRDFLRINCPSFALLVDTKQEKIDNKNKLSKVDQKSLLLKKEIRREKKTNLFVENHLETRSFYRCFHPFILNSASRRLFYFIKARASRSELSVSRITERKMGGRWREEDRGRPVFKTCLNAPRRHIKSIFESPVSRKWPEAKLNEITRLEIRNF